MDEHALGKLLDSEYNHAESRRRNACIDKNGNPIPWMTYPAIFYLEQLDLSGKTVFEWGAGNSSLFFADRVEQITSVEYKKEWYEYVVENRRENMELILADDEEYCSCIDRSDAQYDLIVVDGEILKRRECAEFAVKHLADDGMIILDNSDWLTNTSAFLRDQDLIQVDLAGFGPINNYTWCTSLFISRSYRPIPAAAKQPAFVPGGIQNVRD